MKELSEQAKNIVMRQMLDNMYLASKPYGYKPATKKRGKGRGKRPC